MEKILLIQKDAIDKINKVNDLNELDNIRIEYLSKKGHISLLMKDMHKIDNKDKPKYGQLVNECKQQVTKVLEDKLLSLKHIDQLNKFSNEKIDITLDKYTPIGSNIHPLSIITQQIEDFFIGLGYQIKIGPEVESDIYNFKKANIPDDHPARDMQDTLYIDDDLLLRTHTTAIQTRVLQQQANNLPIRVICPGKVYRNDDDDATHSHQFMQIEGLVVDEDITLTTLKNTLLELSRHLFGEDRIIRFRPSYFQFTEPSVEVDVSCHVCNTKGCSICKGSGWIEVLGAGIVHPNVLEMANIDSKIYSGFAFGVGIERIAMLKYKIDDIRLFYLNDYRFIKQFKRVI